MLLEIRCDKFRKNPISFSPGLNVVLGDENGTNSIGKSSLLMVIDFAFGGSSLTEHNTDIVAELGHHQYFFTFVFEGEKHIFLRETERPRVVYACSDEFEVQQTLRLEQYTAFLMSAYGVNLSDMTFRALVGLYLRVWGKDNLNVSKPLHTSQAQSPKDCVDTLIKTFGNYDEIRAVTQAVESVESELKTLRSAKRHEVVTGLSQAEYKKTKQQISALEDDLADIKNNLAAYATNISAVLSRDMLKLKFEKDDLISTRATIANRLQRVQRNLSNNRAFRSRGFRDLTQYFPEINEERLAKVEDFHNGLSKILREELRQSARELEDELTRVDESIGAIDRALSQSLSRFERPDALIDHVYGVALALHRARGATDMFEREVSLEGEVSELKDALSKKKISVLGKIERTINDGMHQIVTQVFGSDRKSPHLTLAETNYSFDVFEDTGTGTAYAGLVVFDLTIFLNSQLPTIAHDSVLFKNIENDSVSALVQIYLGTEKQSFIALDEVSKYGVVTAALLRDRSAIALDDKNVLYIKDWRKQA